MWTFTLDGQFTITGHALHLHSHQPSRVLLASRRDHSAYVAGRAAAWKVPDIRHDTRFDKVSVRSMFEVTWTDAQLTPTCSSLSRRIKATKWFPNNASFLPPLERIEWARWTSVVTQIIQRMYNVQTRKVTSRQTGKLTARGKSSFSARRLALNAIVAFLARFSPITITVRRLVL